jgi:rhomboid protease GluP
MDWNTVLLWNGVLIAAITLVRLFGHPQKAWDWIAVAAGVLVATAAMWFFLPAIAGYFSAMACALLLIAPGFLQQRIVLLVQDERFAAAVKLSNVSYWLHPFGSYRHQPALLRARQAAAAARVADGIDHEIRSFIPATHTRQIAAATWTLVALNLAMFIVEVATGGSEDTDTLFRLGAVFTKVFGLSNAWRLFAANFLHIGTAHLVFNMLALTMLGPMVERYCGTLRFVMIYLVSGIGAMVGVVLAAKFGLIPDALIVGASGAIMGLVGAQAAIFLRERRQGAHVAGPGLRNVIFVVVTQLVFDQLVPQVSTTAHLGGLAIGFLVTAALLRVSPAQAQNAPRA